VPVPEPEPEPLPEDPPAGQALERLPRRDPAVP
jgi:hypothetical protein